MVEADEAKHRSSVFQPLNFNDFDLKYHQKHQATRIATRIRFGTSQRFIAAFQQVHLILPNRSKSLRGDCLVVGHIASNVIGKAATSLRWFDPSESSTKSTVRAWFNGNELCQYSPKIGMINGIWMIFGIF